MRKMLKNSVLYVTDNEMCTKQKIEHIVIKDGNTAVIYLEDPREIYFSVCDLIALIMGGTVLSGKFELKLEQEFV